MGNTYKCISIYKVSSLLAVDLGDMYPLSRSLFFVLRVKLLVTIFSACPSHVSLDISNDSHVLVPVCEPVLTTGITVIKLKLEQTQVAQVGYLFLC